MIHKQLTLTRRAIDMLRDWIVDVRIFMHQRVHFASDFDPFTKANQREQNNNWISFSTFNELVIRDEGEAKAIQSSRFCCFRLVRVFITELISNEHRYYAIENRKHPASFLAVWIKRSERQ